MAYGINDRQPCACIGAKAGQFLCPCALARRGDQDLRIATLEEQVRQLQKRLALHDAMSAVFGART